MKTSLTMPIKAWLIIFSGRARIKCSTIKHFKDLNNSCTSIAIDETVLIDQLHFIGNAAKQICGVQTIVAASYA